MRWYGAYLRWAYRGRRPNAFVRFENRLGALVFGAGMLSRRAAALEVVGRRSGQLLSLPVVVADWDGGRYLISMLGERASWVRNVRAAGGRAVLVHGRREGVHLDEVPVEMRPPIIRRYLALAPGGRPHIRLDRNAPAEQFADIAPQIPVFRIRPAPASDASR